MNVVSNECGLKWMWSQMNVVSNEWGLKWSGLKWMWSQMKKPYVNVVSNEQVSKECVLKWSVLKWIGLKWMLSQMSWSQMNVVSNEWSQMNGLKWIGLNSHGTVFDSILWFTVPMPHWNNSFSQRWSLSDLSWDIRQNSKFSTDTNVRKLFLTWNRMRIRICYLKHFIRCFEDSGCETNFWSLLTSWRKLHIAQITYYFQKHIFSFLFDSKSIYVSLKTHFWIVFRYGQYDWTTTRIGYECYFLKTG